MLLFSTFCCAAAPTDSSMSSTAGRQYFQKFSVKEVMSTHSLRLIVDGLNWVPENCGHHTPRHCRGEATSMSGSIQARSETQPQQRAAPRRDRRDSCGLRLAFRLLQFLHEDMGPCVLWFQTQSTFGQKARPLYLTLLEPDLAERQ